ncbi:hypothetical protein J4Q44_G00384020, partial [Coregonus suidteri]
FTVRQVAQWSKALHHNASCATRDPGSSPGSVAAGRNRETHGAAHNWSSVVQAQHSFLVSVEYCEEEVLSHEVMGSDVRIAYKPFSLMMDGIPFISLPKPPDTIPISFDRSILSNLLSLMEGGVVLSSREQGIYAERHSQAIVSWMGGTGDEMHVMERDVDPVMLFNRETFRQELDRFGRADGFQPQCGFSLWFGQDSSLSAPIFISIKLPWAQQLFKQAHDFRIWLESSPVSPGV